MIGKQIETEQKTRPKKFKKEGCKQSKNMAENSEKTGQEKGRKTEQKRSETECKKLVRSQGRNNTDIMAESRV